MIQNQEINKLLFILGLFLNFLAIFEWPYGFYTFLRIFNSLLFLSVLINQYRSNRKYSFIFSFVFLILFNPIEKIELEKDQWIIINLITSGYYVFLMHQNSFFKFKIPRLKKEMSEYQREISRLKK